MLGRTTTRLGRRDKRFQLFPFRIGEIGIVRGSRRVPSARVNNRPFQTPSKWQLLSHNPVERIELPKAECKKPIVLDKAKMAALFKRAQNTRLFALTALASATGARRGELLALQWSDLNFETGIMNITKSLEQT